MLDYSLEALKGRIAAGEYAVDSGKVADAMVWKPATIRRVKQILADEDEEPAPTDATRGAPARARGARPSSSRRRRQQRQRHR